MNEDENVVQLQEEMRIKAAFDELKDDDEATQRDACNRFERGPGKQVEGQAGAYHSESGCEGSRESVCCAGC